MGRILAYGEICDHCLGRFFGKRSHGLSDGERGQGLRVAHAIQGNIPYKPHEGSCSICHDLFSDIGVWAARVVGALSGIEYSTFLSGRGYPPSWPRARRWSGRISGSTGPEPLKSEVNREVGKAVSSITGKSADLSHPDVVAILDLAEGTVRA